MTAEEEAAYVREVAAAKTAVLRMSVEALTRHGMPFVGETRERLERYCAFLIDCVIGASSTPDGVADDLVGRPRVQPSLGRRRTRRMS